MARSREEVQEIVEKLGYNLISEYINNKTRRVIIQDLDEYKYDVVLSQLKIHSSADFVAKSNPFSLSNISLWIKKENKPFLLCENNVYKKARGKLFFQCLRENCQEIFDTSWNEVYSMGSECPFCSGQRVGKRNNLAYRRPDLAKEWDYEKNENNPENFTTGTNKMAWWICESGHQWKSRVSDRCKGKECTICNTSKGEFKIFKFLDKKRITFKNEFLIDYKYKKRLLLDFYIPDYNSAIEYDGEQHFFPVDFSGRGEKWAKKEFKKIKEKDKIKTKYCVDKNIKLLRIPYWEFDNIEKILEDFLFGDSSNG